MHDLSKGRPPDQAIDGAGFDPRMPGMDSPSKRQPDRPRRLVVPGDPESLKRCGDVTHSSCGRFHSVSLGFEPMARVAVEHDQRKLRADARERLRAATPAPRASLRPVARPRGAGRPRAAASRSCARSGSSGDDDPAEPEPPSRRRRSRLPLRAARAHVAAELIDGSGSFAELRDELRARLGWGRAAAVLALADALDTGALVPDEAGGLRPAARAAA